MSISSDKAGDGTTQLELTPCVRDRLQKQSYEVRLRRRWTFEGVVDHCVSGKKSLR